MARYAVAIAILAFAVGALFRAYASFGAKFLNMAGMIGLFLIGGIASVAVTQWHARRGRREIEGLLTALGTGYLVTDWTQGSGPEGAPDYVVVGPAGILAISVDGMANTGSSSARRRVAKRRDQAVARVVWILDRLQKAGRVESAPVRAALVLTRQRVVPEDSTDEVVVVNPDGLASALRVLAAPERLTVDDRIRLTRVLRKQAAPAEAASEGRQSAR